ncbi:MAG TPA: hypothetical protein VKF63_08950 [Terracidiphilus sp.]|nr:hypothetical protein [Terracidiphilus sp.]
MKYASYVAFCAILLCCPALRSQSILTLSADDVKFLSGCGVLQEDIKVIPNLPSAGQHKILVILRKNGRECSDIKSYKDTRDHLRKYTPPPSVVPMPPKGYDMDFFTKAEYDYVSKTNNDLLEKLLKQMSN